MGTAFLNFLPGKMSFEEYFQLEGYTENEQYLRFFLGLTPAALQQSYLVDPSKLDLANKKGPSTIMGCQLAAGVAATQVLKIFLNRGDVLNVPWGLHFDAYKNEFKKTWRPGGNSNPIQRLAFMLGKKKFLSKLSQNNENNEFELDTIAKKVLDQARWAPSGDNMQSWQFEIHDDTSFTLHCEETSDHCVYDSDSHSSHIAHGALIETTSIAASGFGYRAEIAKSDLSDPAHLKITINLIKDSSVEESPLFPYITLRSVQRRAMGTRALNEIEKTELEQAIPDNFQIKWFESKSDKKSLAKLNFCNAKTRLTMEEAFQTHKEIIDWKKQFSETKIPEQAVGVDWGTARLMQWMFKSWKRIEFSNKYLAGTILPRIQLDYIPSIKSTAHFAISAKKEPTSIEDYLDAGRVVQRFWLTCTKLGLGFQPEQTPVIFSSYLRKGIKFTSNEKVIENAIKGRDMFESLVDEPENVMFLARIGRSELPKSRSIRKPLNELLKD